MATIELGFTQSALTDDEMNCAIICILRMIFQNWVTYIPITPLLIQIDIP